jgi:hypothetical protein
VWSLLHGIEINSCNTKKEYAIPGYSLLHVNFSDQSTITYAISSPNICAHVPARGVETAGRYANH